MDDLQEYKLRKLEDWKRKAIAEETFPETAFCFDYSSLLADGGHLDDPEILDDAHRDTNRGTRIDGWSWNENEGIITVIVCEFEENDDVLTISKSEIETIGNRATKFLEIAEKGSLDHLDPASSGYQTAQSLRHCMGEDNLVRFRIAVLTSKSMSARKTEGSNSCGRTRTERNEQRERRRKGKTDQTRKGEDEARKNEAGERTNDDKSTHKQRADRKKRRKAR